MFPFGFYEMCWRCHQDELFTIDYGRQQSPMPFTSVCLFYERDSVVRPLLTSWLLGLKDIPAYIRNIFSFYHWSHWRSFTGALNVIDFAAVLFFFEVNQAPLELRRLWWTTIITQPVLDDDGLVSYMHPYHLLYLEIPKMTAYLQRLGAMRNVETGTDLNVHPWVAYNIWGCIDVTLPDFEFENLESDPVLKSE